MVNMMNKYPLLSLPTAKNQAGVVLVISLIMLLALTLIGVTGSNVTGLEEKMVANSKDKNLAFQAAESALRLIETGLSTNPTGFSCTNQGVNGLYHAVTPPTTPYYNKYITSPPTQYVASSSTVESWFSSATDAATCNTTTATTTAKVSIYSQTGGAIPLSSAPSLGGVCRNPRYIIEKIATASNASAGGGSLEVGAASGGSSGETNTYRITVQGWGSNANSAAQVQSIVKVTYSGTSTNTGC